MQINDFLAETGGLPSMARELGVSENEVQNGAAALLPAILGGFKKQAQAQPGGVEGLGGLLASLGGGSLLDDVVSREPTPLGRGNDVLGQIFGSKDVSRAVAGNAASRTGLSPELLKKLLPMLAMLAAGYMSKQRQRDVPAQAGPGGGLGDLLGGLLGNRAAAGAPTARGAGLGGMLDLDGDGNPLDDILRMAGMGGR
jgi:hypothetical protein